MPPVSWFLYALEQKSFTGLLISFRRRGGNVSELVWIKQYFQLWEDVLYASYGRTPNQDSQHINLIKKNSGNGQVACFT